VDRIREGVQGIRNRPNWGRRAGLWLGPGGTEEGRSVRSNVVSLVLNETVESEGEHQVFF